MKLVAFMVLIMRILIAGHLPGYSQSLPPRQGVQKLTLVAPEGRALAAFAEGCFWCVEEVFEIIPGVDSAVSGYAGGQTPYPTYQEVGNEQTGHAESVLVYYDPAVVSYEVLLQVFFASHDPTTPNQQGPDIGPQYRSVIFYMNPDEKRQAKLAKSQVENSKQFARPLVSEIRPLKEFYRAEEFQQNYVRRHPNHPYVLNVSIPRFEKFKKTAICKLKSEAR